jgi:hypothetical protein
MADGLRAAKDGGVTNALGGLFGLPKSPSLKSARVYSTKPRSGAGSPLDGGFKAAV